MNIFYFGGAYSFFTSLNLSSCTEFFFYISIHQLDGHNFFFCIIHPFVCVTVFMSMLLNDTFHFICKISSLKATNGLCVCAVPKFRIVETLLASNMSNEQSLFMHRRKKPPIGIFGSSLRNEV